MSESVLTGTVRKTGRKGPARRLRARGLLPGIVYGLGENVPVTIESRAVMKMLEIKGGVNNIITTKFEGDSKERTVMIRVLDVHPIYDTLLHVDLLEIDIKKPIKVSVAIEYIGVPKGVRDHGGRMSVNLHTLKVECLPRDIPDAIEARIEQMDIGDSLKVKDIIIDAKLKPLDDPETQVIAIATPKVEEVAEPGETEEETLAEGAEKEEGESKAEAPAPEKQ